MIKYMRMRCFYARALAPLSTNKVVRNAFISTSLYIETHHTVKKHDKLMAMDVCMCVFIVLLDQFWMLFVFCPVAFPGKGFWR